MKVKIEFFDEVDREHDRVEQVNVVNGALRVHQFSGYEIGYPLTSIISWEELPE